MGPHRVSYERAISADTTGDGKQDRISYYVGDRLVGSQFDNDGDGRFDLWLRYDADLRLDLEVVDRDGDGAADVAREIDRDERVVNETRLERPLSAWVDGVDWMVVGGVAAVAAVLFVVAIAGLVLSYLLRRKRT